MASIAFSSSNCIKSNIAAIVPPKSKTLDLCYCISLGQATWYDIEYLYSRLEVLQS